MAIEDPETQLEKANKNVETKTGEHFTPRDYQLELLDSAVDHNCIVSLGTGFGKTYIAILLIKEFAYKLLNDGLKAFFVADKIALVQQQEKQVETHTNLSVGIIHGMLNPIMWENKQCFDEFYNKHQVIVCTHEILNGLLNSAFVKMNEMALLIVDECHHVVGSNHPYRRLMQRYRETTGQRPRVLGLTATVVNCNAKFTAIEAMIKNMEYLMCAKLETASQMANLAKYGCKATPLLLEYDDDSRRHESKEANEQVPLFRFVNIQLDGEDLVNSIKDGSQKAFGTLEILGPWCCYQVCTMLVKECKKAEKNHGHNVNRERLVAYALTTFQQAIAYLEPLSRLPNNSDDLQPYTTDQVMSVLRILESRKPTTDRPLSAIVFVRERHVAYLLSLFLNRVASTNPSKYGFIKADYVIGRQGFSISNADELVVANKRQEQTISKFRSNTLNVLVSTSVLEEGIDVKSCNTVIRVAPPNDFRSYIQSRGRARAQNAIYCLMATGKEYKKLKERVEQYQEIERLLVERFSTTNEDVEIDQQSVITDLIEPYIVPSTGAQITMATAIQMVNRYCQKLPSDVFTRLVPEVKVESVTMDGLIHYTAKLYLPINAPYKKAIVLDKPAPTKSLAKIGVALKACKMLHEKKELNDYLLPTGKDAIVNGLLNEVVEDDEYITNFAGRNIKKRRLYDRKISKTLQNGLAEVGVPCNVYIIDIHLVEPLTEEENLKKRKIIDPRNDDAAFGFICKCELPSITQFPAFLRQGKTEITFTRAQTQLTIDEETMQNVYAFHTHLFEDILRVAKNAVEFSPNESLVPLLIVPLIKKHDNEGKLVDCELDRSRLIPDIRRSQTIPTEEERKAYRFNEERIRDAVVTPWYRAAEDAPFYYVAEICYDLNPASDFPDKKFQSFNEYYTAKYELSIYDQEQPLLDVDRASERMNLILPRNAPIRVKTRSYDPTQKQILIPELVHIHPLSATYWTMIIALPTILYRLNQFLLVDELRGSITREALKSTGDCPNDYEWPPLDYDSSHTTTTISTAPTPTSSTTQVPDKAIKHIAQMRRVEPEPTPSDEMTSLMEAAPPIGEQGKSFTVGVWDPNEALQFQTPRTDPFGLYTGSESQAERLGEQAALARTGDEMDISDGEVEEYEILTDFNKGLRETINDMPVDMFAPRDGDLSEAFGWESGPPIIQNEAADQSSNGLISLSGANGIDVSGLMADLQHQLNVFNEPPQKRPKASSSNKTSNGTANPQQTANDVAPRQNERNGRLNEEVIDTQLIEEGSQSAPPTSETFEEDIRKDTVKPEEAPKVADSELSWLVNSRFEVTAPVHPMKFKFNDDNLASNKKQYGVPPALLLQALTTASASDGMNLERLETIGDSFLKLAVTTYLYNKHTSQHEGKLSYARSKEVSNTHLYQLGRRKGLPSIMEASKFDPNVSWLPPGYTSTAVFHATDWTDPDEEIEKIRQAAESDPNVKPTTGWEAADQEEEKPLKIENGVETITLAKANKNPELPSPYNAMTQQCINDKAIADAVEALIGAHLISLGLRPALNFMDWLGLKVLLGEPEIESPLLQFEDSEEDTEKSKRILHKCYVEHNFKLVEERIGYKFGNKAFLVQAFTHASYYKGRVTGCYQRLEFLGDAVLDYLITRFLFEHDGRFAPGILTDLRSALVNNTIFASLAVKHRLHKFFLTLSGNLAAKIEKFVKICQNKEATSCFNFNAELFMVTEEEVEDEEDVEVPKALGDIFESLAGAIYLDCGMDLEVVWRVYYNLMKDEIESCCKNPPLSPVRELFELKGSNAYFTKLERVMETNKIRVTVQIDENLRFDGMGRSFRIAKATAAKRALKYLHTLDLQRRSTNS
ncbi:hypothetical protein M3Y95_00772100 [Aphelenchoides besseyi]|nr:hypothetical protein M3Y95_00772100 [Aphelenchoides besseyi]